MIRAALGAALACAVALPASAQDDGIRRDRFGNPIILDLGPPPETRGTQRTSTAVRTGTGAGAVLRTLDRVSGDVVDVEMSQGQTMAYGPLQVTLHECRFPTNNPSGDAFGLIQVVDAMRVEELFGGWMVASSPALNALEHPRYDVWLLRCITSLD
ncbi:DUF2155 domain-containing protein [Jannaschia sp. Os4]|uniref:DUF2155 domain-containing protein n=1 Tax=Jannaschia sp. Os4 TaxID=2807617 RepID=UPI001939C105|nr:DUF2155 domain-containing protein [Jannaschia sp. Os4]MBM2577598.1 DUF2155 domain-containing protein [Jannaschia sp. Os4]